MKPLSAIKWIKRNSYFWFEDDGEASVIRGWVERIPPDTWKIEIHATICTIYITAYYDKKKDAIAAIPQLLRALPDEWQASIGQLPSKK